VLVGFSLAFLRYWGFESPENRSWHFAISTALMLVSMLMQLIALFRSLQVEDHEIPHYRTTVRWFVWGVVVMVLGLVFAAAEVSRPTKGIGLF
jgi:formate-dependent nitrite reductase membrane component NrfD